MASCMPHKGLFLLGPFTSFSEGVRRRPTGGERHGEAVEVVLVVWRQFVSFLQFLMPDMGEKVP